MAAPPSGPNAERFPELTDSQLRRWDNFCRWPDVTYFPKHLGFEVEEIRQDYCRLRLPFNPDYNQPAGFVHGGALASLIDTCVVPAVGWVFDGPAELLTLSMNIDYLGAVREDDAIAEGWVTRRGRSIVFCQVAVWLPNGDPVATSSIVYKARAARS